MNTLQVMIEQFHFLRPWWLVACLPALLLFLALRVRRTDAGNWQGVIAPHLLPHLLQGGRQVQESRTPLYLLLAAWLLACIGLAGPTWEKLPAAVKKKVDARVIVMDLTLSMLATDTTPSRLVRAKFKLSDILSRSREGMTGLVVFAGSAHVVSPLTDDANTILSMAESLSPEIMPVRGSDPLAALTRAAEVLRDGGVDEGQILFIGDDLPEDYADALEPVRDRIRLSVLAVGTAEGAPIALGNGRYLKDDSGRVVVPAVNHARMREAALRYGGSYSPLTADDADINLLLADFLAFDDNVRESQREFDIWEDMGGWLALLILPLAAAGYRRGWLGALLLPLLAGAGLLHAPAAQADPWSDLWRNPDQQGQHLLDSGDARAAAERFKSPDWKAAAQYKAGDYAGAEAFYREQADADGRYNLGNALARQGKLEQALQAYEDALKQNPALEDARANAEEVRKLLQQQQASGQGQGASDGKPDGEGQQDKDGEPGEKGQPQDAPRDRKNQDQGKPGDSGTPPQDAQGNADENSSDQAGDQSGTPPRSGPESGSPSSPDQQDGQDKNPPPGKQDDKPTPGNEAGDGDDAEQREAEKPNATAAAPEDGQPGDNPGQPQGSPQGRSEEDQAMQQWLNRVPDDPGGLLRRKFEFESRLRRNAENQNGTEW